MLHLITGLPGSGKTLYALPYVERLAADIPDGYPRERLVNGKRPVYVNGVDGLNRPDWNILERGEDWHQLPYGSIIFLDEGQRLFRPRGNGAEVPKHVAELETHRHEGYDIVVTTQHPMLLDSNFRRLCGRHFHVKRAFGMGFANIHEWPEVKVDCDKSQKASIEHKFVYPKEVYSWYKSAEVHTHKRRIPARLFFIVLIPIVIGACGWYLYKWQMGKMTGTSTFTGQTKPAGQAGQGGLYVDRGGQSGKPLTRLQWLELQAARLRGLPQTAPVYDEVTKPVIAPYPAAAVIMNGKCKAYTQQATPIDMDDQMCRGIAAHGIFIAWQQQAPVQVRDQVEPQHAQEPAQVEVSPPPGAVKSWLSAPGSHVLGSMQAQGLIR